MSTDRSDTPVDDLIDGRSQHRDHDRHVAVDSAVPVDGRSGLTDAEVARLRAMLDDGSFDSGANRFTWFMLGFLAALLALVVAAGAFLVVSDDDDDGQVDVDVPSVEVDG